MHIRVESAVGGFISCSAFHGSLSGFVFRNGNYGIGYYGIEYFLACVTTLLYAYLITTYNPGRLPCLTLVKTTRRSDREISLGVWLSDSSSGYS